jgi:riboflavin kinase/FMN adenylyltransferase
MRIIRDYQFVKSSDKGASVAVGNFDGVHIGHQHVIEIARQWGYKNKSPLGVLTFEPHPRSYFFPEGPNFRLMSSDAKATRLNKLNVEKLYELNFNKTLSSLTPFEFADQVISKGLGLRHLVVGEDFCFGKGRVGTVKDLISLGSSMGFEVTIAELMETEIGQVSSTSIRNALAEGRPKDAAKQLGHWHRIEGLVRGGEQRGRELGYPTANMSLDGLHLPHLGVYAVLVDVLNGEHVGSYNGVASLGVRPMFGENTPNLETFIFDFSGDLYGATLSVALIEFMRPEIKFDSLENLVVQMDQDSLKARAILKSLK